MYINLGKEGLGKSLRKMEPYVCGKKIPFKYIIPAKVLQSKRKQNFYKRKKSGFLTVHSPTALRTRSLRIKCVCKESLTNIVKKILLT
jgi:hypothetical protein